jgi:multidrug efflux pump
MGMSTDSSGSGRFNISRWALEHPSLTRYLMAVLLLAGVVAFFQLGQDEDPPFTFRAMVVQAFWPGATAQQMADQVTDKVERTLQEVPYADKIRSFTKPGESLTIFYLKDSVAGRDVPNSFYQVRKKLGDIRHTLPQGVLGPFYNDEFGDVYGTVYALAGDGYSAEDLRRHAEDVRARLLRVPDVAKVELFGVRPEKVYVEISHKKLAQLGIDFSAVIAQLNAQNAIEGAGLLNSPEGNVGVRVDGQFGDLNQLRELPIRAQNPTTGAISFIRLGDLATVTRGYAEPQGVTVRHQGREVVALGVSMAKGGDIIRLGKQLASAVEALKPELPAGLELQQVQDQPQAVKRSVGEFVQVLVEAVVVVLAVSFISLGLHTRPLRIDIWPGLVVGITIPLVLAITFVTMFYWSVGLHKISLGALIIALGLLVDDAIIAVEMMVRKLEEGHDKLHAASFAYEVTSMPMLTGTLITAVGFLPIALARSAVGEYTFAIFAVTAAALVISWFVSVYFVPYLGALLLHTRPAQPGEAHELFDTPFYTRFRAMVRWCVVHRWITLGLTLAVFLLGLAGMGKVQQQFFPDSSRPEILVDLWLPEGAPIQQTEQVLPALLARSSPRRGGASSCCPTARRCRTRCSSAWSGRTRCCGAGPMRSRPSCANPNMRGVNDNWNESVKVLRLEVDQDKARALGVSSQSIAQAPRTILAGTTVGQYREGDKLIDIVLRQPLDERNAITDLAAPTCPPPSGKSDSADPDRQPVFTWEPGVMWREGRDYAITVQGDVVEGMQGATVTGQNWPKLQGAGANVAHAGPPGYRIESPARWRRAARARRPSRPGCRSCCSSPSRC